MNQSITLTIYGRVQGVGFRYFVKRKADELNIEGFVKNRPDGSVYVEAEGMEGDLQMFALACQQGPSHSRVDRTDIQYCPLQGFREFVVR